jgi:hypothetical protein
MLSEMHRPRRIRGLSLCALRVVWVAVVLWYETGIFWFALRDCQWPDKVTLSLHRASSHLLSRVASNVKHPTIQRRACPGRSRPPDPGSPLVPRPPTVPHFTHTAHGRPQHPEKLARSEAHSSTCRHLSRRSHGWRPETRLITGVSPRARWDFDLLTILPGWQIRESLREIYVHLLYFHLYPHIRLAW